MSTFPLCVVGHGALGASGLKAAPLSAAVWSDISPFVFSSRHDFGIGECVRIAPCPLFDESLTAEQRLLELVHQVLSEVLDNVGSTRLRVQLFLALPTWATMPGFTRQIRKILKVLGAPFADSALSVIRGDTTAGMVALRMASRLLQNPKENGSKADLAVVVGADTCFDRSLLASCHRKGLLSTELSPVGIIAGEGAAALVLANEQTAARYGLQTLGKLDVPCIENHLSEVARKENLCQMVSQAIDNNLALGSLAAILADASSIPWRTEALMHTLVTCRHNIGNSEMVLPLQRVGELGAAFAPLSIILAIFGMQTGILSHHVSLVFGSDDRCAAAIGVWAPMNQNILLEDFGFPYAAEAS